MHFINQWECSFFCFFSENRIQNRQSQCPLSITIFAKGQHNKAKNKQSKLFSQNNYPALHISTQKVNKETMETGSTYYDLLSIYFEVFVNSVNPQSIHSSFINKLLLQPVLEWFNFIYTKLNNFMKSSRVLSN